MQSAHGGNKTQAFTGGADVTTGSPSLSNGGAYLHGSEFRRLADRTGQPKVRIKSGFVSGHRFSDAENRPI